MLQEFDHPRNRLTTLGTLNGHTQTKLPQTAYANSAGAQGATFTARSPQSRDKQLQKFQCVTGNLSTVRVRQLEKWSLHTVYY
jgi:hypothetical protein